MEVIFAVLIIVAAILNLILFFKIWGMTDDIKSILNLMLKNQNPSKNKKNKSSTESFNDGDGWS